MDSLITDTKRPNGFDVDGFAYFPKAISLESLHKIQPIIEKFHQAWLIENQAWYQEKAINSAYLTRSKALTESDKLELFKFIASDNLNEILRSVFPGKYSFLNTQLFFDPFHAKQANYWHRDFQYLTNEDQQKWLLERARSELPQVVHVRIPLSYDPGVEVIPGSHLRWDSSLELDVRYSRNNKQVSDSLPNSHSQSLNLGDAFVFSANMIHRGLYGHNRLALDLIFFEPDRGIEEFVETDCLPSQAKRSHLRHPDIFILRKES